MSTNGEYPHKFNPGLDNRSLTHLTFWSMVGMFVDMEQGKTGGIHMLRGIGCPSLWRARCEGRLMKDIGPVPAGTHVFVEIFGDEVELRYDTKKEIKFSKKKAEDEAKSDEEESEKKEYTFHIRHSPEIILP